MKTGASPTWLLGFLLPAAGGDSAQTGILTLESST